MRFGIIGLGVVGAATKAAGEHYGHECVWVHDPPKGLEAPDDLGEAELTFICLPSPVGQPTLPCDQGLVWLMQRSFEGLRVMRSTVPPGAVAYGRNVANPEFLRAREAVECTVNPPYIVVGADDPDSADLMRRYYQPWIDQQVPYFETDTVTAEWLKYATNLAIASEVATANELFDMAQRVGADYSRFVEVCRMDPQFLPQCVEVPGPDGQRGFGGACLPKDLEAALTWGDRWRAGRSVLREVYQYNREVREADAVVAACNEWHDHLQEEDREVRDGEHQL